MSRTAAISFALAAITGIGFGYLFTPAGDRDSDAAQPAESMADPLGAADPRENGSNVDPSPFKRIATALDRVATATADELPELLELALNNAKGNPYESQILRRAILERWAEVDPAGGATHFFTIRQYDAQQIFAAWAKRDPDAAMAAALGWSSDDETERDALYHSVVSQIGLTDPKRFRDLVLKGDPPITKRLFGVGPSRAIGELAAVDLDSAWELLQALPADNHRDGIVSIAKTLAAQDASNAVQWAKDLKNKEHVGAALGTIANALCETDPDAAADLLQYFPDPEKFPAYTLAKRMIERGDDPEATFDWLLKNNFGDAAGSLFVSKLLGTDPDAALANADRILKAVKKPPYGFALKSVGQIDPAKIPELAANIQPGTHPDIAIALAAAWGKQDPQATLNWIATYLPSTTGSSSVRSLHNTARGLLFEAANAPGGDLKQELTEFSAKLPAGPREQLIGSMAQRLAEMGDPEMADFFLNDLGVSDRLRERFVHSQFSHLADQDPELALAKMAELTEPILQNEAAEMTAYHWANYDPHAASTWAATLSPGLQRDNAASGLAAAVMQHAPAQGLAWLASIDNAEVRSWSIQHYSGSWRPGSMDEANGVLAGVEFTPEEKSAILAKIETRLAKDKR